MADFYVILPSNTSVSEFVDNRPSNFKIPFPAGNDLGQDYEVALVQLDYTFNWTNVPSTCKMYFDENRLKRDEDDDFVYPETINSFEINVSGYYDSIEDLLNFMNNNIPNFITAKFNYSPGENRVWYEDKTKASSFGYGFSPPLMKLLGMSMENPSLKINDYYITKGDKAPTFQTMPYFYVYSNIVKDSFIGNVFAPFLRLVSVGQAKRRQHVQHNFTDPHYFQIRHNTIPYIEIGLYDHTGKELNFGSNKGSVIAMLHFRKRKIHL
jgi:hypothetical protein